MLPESALCISCHSLTCGRKGQLLFHVCQRPASCFMTALALSVEYKEEKKIHLGKDFKKYIQKHHAKAFPLSLVDLFLPLCSLILSQRRTTLFEHSVSPLCLHGKKKVLIHACFCSASFSAQPTGQYKKISQSHIYLVSIHLQWRAPSLHGNILEKKGYKQSPRSEHHCFIRNSFHHTKL